MATLDREKLISLASERSWPSITLYLPTHIAGPAKEQDRIRLKNLLKEACERLVYEGMRESDVPAFCAPIQSLLEDATFWRSTAHGLAVFHSATTTQTVLTGLPLPESVVVGDRFYLRPLIAADRGERPYFALALDRNGCRLFRGIDGAIDEVTLEGVPASLADELRYDEVQPAVQYSSVPAPGRAAGGGRPTGAVFHGHGGEKDADKNNLERYLRKIESAASDVASLEPGVPLLLLGVDYEIALYRSLNTSPALVDAHVTGATDELSPQAVAERASKALEPHFRALLDADVAELAEKEGTSLASRDPAAIVAAAATGRVKTLYFDDSVGPFGRFDRERLHVDLVCDAAPRLLREHGSEDGEDALRSERGWDLVDLAAAETALHGGSIVAFSGEDPPVKGVAAVMRY